MKGVVMDHETAAICAAVGPEPFSTLLGNVHPLLHGNFYCQKGGRGEVEHRWGESMPQYFNRRHQVEVRRRLRRDSTLAERILWRHVRNRQLEGLKFRRQFGILEYVVDFYCMELQLAIEVDGITHATAEAQERDRRRQRAIESLGVRFLRIQDDDVVSDLDGTLNVIREVVTRLWGSSSSPRPLLCEEGESAKISTSTRG